MEITLFASAKDPTADPSNTTTWDEVVELLAFASTVKHHRSEKLLAPAIIVGRCEDTRANANVRFLSLIAADFDIGPDDPRYRSFDGMVEYLETQNLAYVIYTTTSNTKAHNRYRVIMPLERDVRPEHWLAVWQAANAKFANAFDPATKDPARLSFLPALWTGNPFQCARKGEVTLDDPFNDFAVGEGGFILTETELLACEGMPQTRPLPARAPSHATATAATTPRQQAIPATYPAVSPMAWKMLTDVKGPLVTRWMRQELPKQEGSRTYRFLKAAAYNAQNLELPINTSVLFQLTRNWLSECCNRGPSADLIRQAENALLFVQQNPTPTKPTSQRKATM